MEKVCFTIYSALLVLTRTIYVKSDAGKHNVKTNIYIFFLFLFFFLKADYEVCLLAKRKKDGTVINRTNSAHRTLDIAMHSDCSGERLVININAVR